MEELRLTKNDFDEFQRWIALNLEDVTWQGRFKDEFSKFWNYFFADQITIDHMMLRFQFAKTVIKTGPLYSWFKWLEEKMVCYCFVKCGLSIYEISRQAQIPISKIGLTVRNFYADHYPHLEEEINDLLQVGNITSENLYVVHNDLAKKLELEPVDQLEINPQVMQSLEVTLYSEWKRFLMKMKREFSDETFDIGVYKKQFSWRKQKKFLKEAFILFVIGGGIMFSIHFVNKKYEKYILEKISIFEPEFIKFDQMLTAQEEEPKTEIKIDVKNLEDIEKAERSMEELTQKEEDRFETETDVSITSLDSLPKNFGRADLETSTYEEIIKGGYRDIRYGRRKVYRLLMKSDDPFIVKSKVSTLLKTYGAKQVDIVKPGTRVPGGLYYNLYVPRVYLTEFLASVAELEESVLYENKSRGINPPGMNRVFIFIQRI